MDRVADAVHFDEGRSDEWIERASSNKYTDVCIYHSMAWWLDSIPKGMAWGKSGRPKVAAGSHQGGALAFSGAARRGRQDGRRRRLLPPRPPLPPIARIRPLAAPCRVSPSLPSISQHRRPIDTRYRRLSRRAHDLPAAGHYQHRYTATFASDQRQKHRSRPAPFHPLSYSTLSHPPSPPPHPPPTPLHPPPHSAPVAERIAWRCMVVLFGRPHL